MTGVEELVEWIDPDGVTTTLQVEWDVSGRFAPPIAMEEDGVPEQPGMRLRAVRHEARDFALPLYITADSQTELRTATRALVATMDPTRGDGRIRITGPGGDPREITCRYQGGLEMSERLGDTSGPEMQRAVAMFRAHDPYWYDTSETVDPFTIGAPSSWFPFFPLRLGASELYATVTIDNLGDVAAWPVWQIQGPGSDITLRNLTTGKSLSLAVNLGADAVTIDTRPGRKSVVRTIDGANLFGSLSLTSSLWPLQRGVNIVRVEMALATTDSAVQLSRKHAYLTV